MLSINYHGFINDIRKVIYNSDCVVLPSFREGTSKALLESLSCGRPIITSDVPGCNHLVDNFNNGFLCTKNDIYSLYECINKYVLLTSMEKNKLSYNSRKFIENKYDEELVIKNYLNILEK